MGRRVFWLVALLAIVWGVYLASDNALIVKACVAVVEAVETEEAEEVVFSAPLVFIACAPAALSAPEPEPPGRRVGERMPVFSLRDPEPNIGSRLSAWRTDANGNPILGGTYAASVPQVFALSDLPI